jgi:hypothetical protein
MLVYRLTCWSPTVTVATEQDERHQSRSEFVGQRSMDSALGTSEDFGSHLTHEFLVRTRQL